MFEIEKTLLKPNIPRTIRFTPILYDWILEVSEKEGLSFNQIVLLCCKYANGIICLYGYYSGFSWLLSY